MNRSDHFLWRYASVAVLVRVEIGWHKFGKEPIRKMFSRTTSDRRDIKFTYVNEY